MHDAVETSMLQEGFVLLGFALAFVLVFRRLGLGATLRYLVAGAVVGPQVLGLVADPQGNLRVSELGITLLLSSSDWSPAFGLGLSPILRL